MNPFAYAKATSLQDASKKLQQGGLQKAGGIDLLGRMKRNTLHPDLLVDLSNLSDLTGMQDLGEKGWKLGALSKLADLAELDPKRSPGLAGIREAAEQTATPQIRNRATLAGNLLQSPRCWYLHDPEIDCSGKTGSGCPALEGRNEYHAILDYEGCPAIQASNLAPVLCALDARIVYRPAAGVSQELALRSLFVAPGNKSGFRAHGLPEAAIVEAIHIPPGRRVTAHEEIRHKKSYDWALCSAAVALELRDGKIHGLSCYLGSVAPTPYHAAQAESLLEGRKPERKTLEEAAAAELARAKPLSEGAYKFKMSQVCLIRALESAVRRAEESQR